jgi:hypothetical protein
MPQMVAPLVMVIDPGLGTVTNGVGPTLDAERIGPYQQALDSTSARAARGPA